MIACGRHREQPRCSTTERSRLARNEGTMKKRFSLAILVTVTIAILGLAACNGFSSGSLLSTHPNGELSAGVYDDATCISCHPEADIIAASSGYIASKKINIHNPPLTMQRNYGVCISCHQIEEKLVITCNRCHNF